MRESINPSFCNCLNLLNMIVSIYINFLVHSVIVFHCVHKSFFPIPLWWTWHVFLEFSCCGQCCRQLGSVSSVKCQLFMRNLSPLPCSINAFSFVSWVFPRNFHLMPFINLCFWSSINTTQCVYCSFKSKP